MRTHLAAAVAAAAVLLPAAAMADVPRVGDTLSWPNAAKWVSEGPVGTDAAGRVVILWFCSVKVPECADDLARVVELKDAGKVYVIAYIADAKSKKAAMKLDPLRDDVGAGALAFGKDVDRLAATLGLPTGGSIVLDTDGKVALVAPSTEPDFLDKRDAKVKALVDAIKEYTVSTTGGGKVTVGERFNLEVNVVLSAWNTFNAKAPLEIELGALPNVTCTSNKLTTTGVRMDARTMTGTFSCIAAKAGSYEAAAQLRFGYTNPRSATGVGADSTRWKFTAAAK
jgi:hypothetical protein